MQRAIVTDPMALSQKSTQATPKDLPVVQDLIDTVMAHRDHCVGMAANMIGVQKRIIVLQLDGLTLAMLNPVITKKYGGTYEAEEGCLSHVGTKKTKRYHTIDVTFCDLAFQKCRQTFSGFAAQVIQHEVDHCDGILI
ncbi:MAG: peptide deformylase [Oscillospiraceae bacterium]|nr:peptide deformylase [Oscillospiraceae bacterium]